VTFRRAPPLTTLGNRRHRALDDPRGANGARPPAAPLTMRTFCWLVLLPFVLLFAQHGALRHAYAHEMVEASHAAKAPSGSDRCAQCAVYAQLAGAAPPAAALSFAVSVLTSHHAAAAVAAHVDTKAFAPRSRGPPSPL
jgi:hypothetical protein